MPSITPASWSYTEYAQLPNQVRDDAQGIEQAAKHFESLFINMWLKSAREANAVLAKDSIFGSNEMEMQQQMFDSQMAMHLSKEGGIGLAPVIMRQLSGGIAAPTVEPAQEPLPRVSVPETTPPVDGTSAAATTVATQHGSRGRSFSDLKAFVDTIAPKIERIAGAAGLPALAVMAQAALETGWGQAVIEDGQGNSSHNLFGLKDTNWSGPSVEIHSKEFLFGRWQDKLAGFRAYPDWDSGIADYVNAISQSARYGRAAVEQLGAADYADFLQQAGYATDPDYASKIKSIMRRLTGLGL